MKWLALVPLIAACAGSETRAVTIRGLEFRPADLEVRVGDSVAWHNEDIVPHTVTIPGREDPDEVPAGGTLTVLMDRVDTLEYFCRYHPAMTGRLVTRR